MTGFNIRTLQSPSELSACASMMMASNPWNKLYFSQEQCEENLGHSSIVVYGAVLPDSTVVGFLAAMSCGIGLEPMIEYLCVGEAYRGRGIGTQLISYFEDVLFPQADNLYLFVSDINPNAIRLYARLGYLQVGAFPNFNLAGQTEFLHRKSRRPVQDRRRLVAGR